MKPLSPALDALFQTRQFVSCDLYSFALADGGGANLTSAEVAVSWNGVTYQPTPLSDRTAITQNLGLEVTSLDITVYPAASDAINGVTWLSAMRRGMFDGASVTVQRLFGANWSAWTGSVTMLAGRVADVDIGRSKGTITVNSWTEVLSNQMPRNYYQSSCGNTLYDANCGVPRTGYQIGGSILYALGPPTALAFYTTLTAGDGFYNLGTIRMVNGACAGEWRPIKASLGTEEAGFVALQVPFSVAPAVGDEFIAWAGCDKQLSTCQAKFNNVARFRGYPFIPAPVMAI